jgi:hypothetical protein
VIIGNGMRSKMRRLLFSYDSFRARALSVCTPRSFPRAAPVSFVHAETQKRLYTRRNDQFDQNNCRGCPMIGQLEISAHTTGVQDPNALWVAEDGIYFPVTTAA